VVHAVHIVQVPDQTPLDRGAEQIDRIDAESAKLLEQAREHAEEAGCDDRDDDDRLPHRSFEEVFDAARQYDADQVVMGWGADRPWATGRAEQPARRTRPRSPV